MKGYDQYIQNSVKETQPEVIEVFGSKIPISALETTGFWFLAILISITIILVFRIKYKKGKG